MTMFRCVSAALALALSLAAPLRAQRAPAPGSARAVAIRSLNAIATHNGEAFAREASPQDLAAFRAQLLPGVQQAFNNAQQRPQALALFAPAKSYAEVEKLPAERLFAIYIQSIMSRVAGAGKMDITNTIIGEVVDGDSLTHVVYRQRVASVTIAPTKVMLLSLRRTPGGWKVMLDSQMGPTAPPAPAGAR